MSVRRRAEDVLFGPETGARLAVVVTGLTVLLGARIALGPYRALAATPDELFDPVAVLAWLPGMPSATTIVVLQVVGAAAAVAALALPRWRRVGFAVAWGCLLVLAGLRGSRGKILHNDLLLLWAAVPFLLAPLELAWGDRRASRAWGWPIRTSMAVAALCYGLAGLHKATTSGLHWALGDNVRYVLLWGSPASPRWASVSEWVADHAVVAKGTGLLMLGVELTFPLILVLRRLQPWYAIAAVALHVATYLFLGLDYWTWAAVALLLFVDWPSLRARRGGARGGPGSAVGCSPVVASIDPHTEVPR